MSRIPYRSWVIGVIAIASFFLFRSFALAAGGGGQGAGGHDFTLTFLWITVILVFAKLSSLIEKVGQPSVLGELVIGVVLGNLALVGLDIFEPIKEDTIIAFLAEFGVIILLFQIGLESNIAEMRKVGLRAFLVAIIGVVVPFILGTYFVGPWLFPTLDFTAYLFLGATLTATSVGITARVFQDMKKLHLPEAKIVLGAAVIDDVLGLIILAIVTGIATLGGVGLGMISWIAAKSILFLVGAIVLGRFLAPYIGKSLAKIHAGVGMKLTLAVCFCFLFSYLAHQFGLASIVGAFAAGLLLDPVHFHYFRDPKIVRDIKSSIEKIDPATKQNILTVIEGHSRRHIEDLITPLGHIFVPIFFVVTGMGVQLQTMMDTKVLLIALVLTFIAVIGKLVSGIAAGSGVNRWIVGFGMVPRGEVGLIFASIGRGLDVINDEAFSIIVIMVILSTLMTPPILAALIKKMKA